MNESCHTGGVAMAACGLGFTCAVTHAGTLFTWGVGSYGVLGQNDTRDRSDELHTNI